MAILNVTPDSFAGGIADPESAIAAALRMEAEGADLIDVGGESTRPGARATPADEELSRVVPVINALALRLKIPISVDTRKSPVARAALDAGAAIVNDVSGLRHDPALAAVAAETGAALVLMHSRGTPKTMNDEAVYGDVVRDAAEELRRSVAAATAAGVPAARIIVDPGLGFAK